MNIKQTASSILKYIGGEPNVLSFTHCATRLRFVVKDESKVNFEELKKVDGVLKVINNYQVQIVIGNEVTDVFNEIQKLGKFEGASENAEVKKEDNQKLFDKILGFLVGIFAPLVPAVTGAGLLKAILILLSNFELVSTEASTYQLLLGLADATFYFVPVLVAVTTAEKMNVNKIVALGAVVPLVFPNIVTMITDGTSMFGLGVTNIQYSSQVFPAMLAIIFLSYVYKFFEKHSPKALKSFLVPLMSYVLTFIVTLFVLGPLGFYVGEILSTVVVFLYNHLGFVGVAICGIIYPIAVATGMHKAFLPYLINSMSTIGYEIMWASASLCHNIAESGAMYGIALRTKDPETRSKAITNGVSAMLGITEPALYSYTLVNKKVMTAVMIGGGISGAYAGFVALKCFATASPGILTLPIYSSPADPNNFIQAIVVTAIAMVSTAVVSFIMWKDPVVNVAEKIESNGLKNKDSNNNDSVQRVKAPARGKAVALEQVNDELFSSKALGDGVAIIPDEGIVYAPFDGKIEMLFETKHAVGFKAKNGAELLIHIGIDTVSLGGKGFDALKKAGDAVKAGEPIIKFDIDIIRENNLDPIIPIVVTNAQEYQIDILDIGQVTKEDTIFEIKERGLL